MKGGRGRISLVIATAVALVVAVTTAVLIGVTRDAVDLGGSDASPVAVPAGWTPVGGAAPDGWTSATSTLPEVDGEVGPARVSPDLPPPTNRWYSGMLFGDTPQPVFAVPLALLAGTDGVSIGLPDVTATPKTIAGAFAPRLRLGLPATSFAATRADPVSLTTTYSTDQGAVGRLQVAEGWPYVAYTAVQDQAITVTSGLTPTDGGRWASAEIGGATYGIAVAGPDGEPVDVQVSGDELRLEEGQSVLAFGAPDTETAATLAAGAVPITGTNVAYEVKDGAAGTSITYETLGGRPTVVAAMPHHQLIEPADPVGEIQSVYGPLRLHQAGVLATSVPAISPRGTLALGELSETDRGELQEQVAADVAATVDGPASPQDTYFGGKAAYRLAQLYRIADSVGADDAAERARERLVSDLDAWLQPGSCSAGSTLCFTYDKDFRGVVGQAPSFGSELFNDHHFHYGYFLAAAALAAETDAALVERWKPTLDALADDIAAPYSSTAGPALRMFDPYAGHSWAAGLSPFADGNNQESSSEAVSAWNGLALWAQVAGDDTRAQQAAWHLSVESAAASAYWLQPSDLPDGYDHPFVSLNWGGKRDWATWFSPDPAAILGIQLIPMPPTFLETDLSPDRVRANLADATPNGYRVPFGDYLTMYLATVDPERALDIGRTLPDSSIDDGDSRSYLLAWLLTQ